ncbi:class II aldolase/adducin family protein [candidate division KSB1 bacterium]|nr:class II aldolase/adducin family protein [candidate division KSB1 bacterium]MBL7093545.1 class II aldolase/adducin family protein [candidate division KSB1 bacterium]
MEKQTENTQQIYDRFRKVGAAISRINANNTHSGNLSMRDPNDDDFFYITSSGSQCGALIPTDLVPIRFSGVSWGDARGSTESTIHRTILNMPGVNAVIHAHYLNSTFISFDSKYKQMFLYYLGIDSKGREEYLYHPVDIYGAYVVGGVEVGSYHQPVGSAEMEERIPIYLHENKITIVRGHGPFARGVSPEDVLYRLSVLDLSSKLSIFLSRRGINVTEIQKEILEKGKDIFFPLKPHSLNLDKNSHSEISDETVINDFRLRLNYNYNNSIGAYGTGSMSQKISATEMIYCPMSAMPEEFKFPLYKKNIEFKKDDTLDLKIHKLIYQNTHQNTCMITTSPLATAEGMAILAENYGIGILMGNNIKIPYSANEHPVILPIDAEAIYLNPKLGLVDMFQLANDTAENPILNMLRWYKGCCVVAGYAVISTGETTLEQAAHNASSAERIAQFRSEVFINEKLLAGPSVKSFEPH